MIMACPKMEYLMEVESAIARTNDVTEKGLHNIIYYLSENYKLRQSVDLYTFAVFLYVHQINKLSLRSSVASVSGE